MTQARRSPSPQESASQEGSGQGVPANIVESVYREYHRDLLAFLLGVLRDSHLAQDALQQTFQRFAESGGQARPEALRGWLFQVAYREALQIRRKAQREDKHLRSWIPVSSAGVSADPADRLLRQELLEKVQTALKELPLEQRQILERRIHGDETFAEIAASTSTPLGTVLTRMRLALERLRKHLRDG